ncbi:MAG: cell division protein FtsQ/DivIB, partial [Gemmobacter sp.]
PRRDPAPSRLAYRMHRLWLSPGFRRFVRFGLPAAAMAAILAGALSDPGRRDAIRAAWDEMAEAFRSRPEFMVTQLTIEGTSPILAEALRADLGLSLPMSSFELDLAALRARVEAFDAVARADLRILSGGTLRIGVTERLPAVVWRSADGLWLLDAEGHRVAEITARAMRGDLPLIAGEGADRAAAEALELVAAAGPLLPRLRGLVRVGERRWDLVLDRDQRILLPATGARRALERVIALDAAEGLLARDLVAIDLRNDRRPLLRLTPEAAEALRQFKLTETGGSPG